MNEPFQLVTNCNFKGKDYLVQMCVLNSKKLELIITDKIMAEDWQCEYNASYIEALTHKTGNFKQFDVFVMMLKSGLLKTSDCISLDLLTLEDLEHLRCKKIINPSSSRTNQYINLNKRYLILTYSVEFDRIHYPLPLDYCGPPDPVILQNNIRRLECEIERLKQKNILLTRSDVEDVEVFKEKIQSLVEENKLLTNEIHHLNKIISKKSMPAKSNQIFVKSLKKLEEQVMYEKNYNRQTIIKLKSENKQLKHQIEELKKKEKFLNLKLKDATRHSPHKSCRRLLRNALSPENLLDQKRSSTSQRLDAQFSCQPVSSWNDLSVTKSQELRCSGNSQNRFLSSSSCSSEAEKKESYRARSREKKPSTIQDICSKKNECCRKSSNERSRHGSESSKKNIQTQRSRLSAASQEGKLVSSNFAQSAHSRTGSRSRESSLSSRNSSKHSRLSRVSNRGSGDSSNLQKKTPRSLLNEKEGTFFLTKLRIMVYHGHDQESTCDLEKSTVFDLEKKFFPDIKFTMSDLEARIRSLQKLLSEGLQF